MLLEKNNRQKYK